jgi:uncharacterized membrane protein
MSDDADPPAAAPHGGATADARARRARRRFSRSDTARVEAFSDGVFAIAVTILVLGIATPEHGPGGLGRALLHQWPAYVGYLASFAYVAVIWLNHHQAFVRIRTVDRGLSAANLLVLGTTALPAFPTEVLSSTLRAGLSTADARSAVALYGAVGAAMCLSWVLLYARLHGCPELLEPGVEPYYVRLGLLRSVLGIAVYAVAALVGVLLEPVVALAAYALLPIFYFLTSEGAVTPEA